MENLDILYNLNHNNIVKAIPLLKKEEIFDEKENIRIIYESLNSKNLEDILKTYGHLDEKMIQNYTRQLLA